MSWGCFPLMQSVATFCHHGLYSPTTRSIIIYNVNVVDFQGSLVGDCNECSISSIYRRLCPFALFFSVVTPLIPSQHPWTFLSNICPFFSKGYRCWIILFVFVLTHKVYNSLLFVKAFHLSPSSVIMLMSLRSFAGNWEGPSQAFENPHSAICQSGVRGPTVSLCNRLQNTFSGTPFSRRWGGTE